jgi:hypothetical protein
MPQLQCPDRDPTLRSCWGYFLGQLASWAISGKHRVAPGTGYNPFTFTYMDPICTAHCVVFTRRPDRQYSHVT